VVSAVVDPRAPVVVGVAQLVQRPDDPADAREPVAMMCEVAQDAIADAGAGLGAHAEIVVAVKGAWSYRDPARIVADAIGATGARTALTTDGGNTPQLVVDVLGERIARGELDVAVVVGAEAIWSRRRIRAQGLDRQVTPQGEDVVPDERIGADLALTDEHERARGLAQPIEVYPLFEAAIRHRRGETVGAHRDRIATLWAGFNDVAVTNPFAWSRTSMTAAEIREPSRHNRMVAFPYTKAMCSNWDLDQAAALVLCSAEAAERHGVPRDRWIFVHGGAEADDTPLVSHRNTLGRSPAIGAAWSALSQQCGIGVDDVAHLDLYSCFPSAVQAATEAIGVDESRRLTVTGGLTFAGGPLNNYVTHSIATMVQILRNEPSTLGLVTANGGFLTKHALGIYSGQPSTMPFRRTRVADADIRHEPRAVATDATGAVTIEASTVMHGHDGPERALFATRTLDGRRAWGNSDDAEVMTAAITRELAGLPAHLDGDGRLTL
jgi:acetyl-CoA C-acetyltransferase